LAERLRVALAQTSSDLGRVSANLKKHLSLVEEARKKGCDVICFPELSLTGYVLRDLIYHMPAPCEAALQKLAEASKGIYTIAGFVEEGRKGILYNSVAVLKDAKILSVTRKLFLPTYGLFEEKRYFSEGESAKISVVESAKGPFGICICEDAWHFEPASILSAKGAEVIFCPAASPSRGYGVSQDGSLGIQRSWRSLAAAHSLINNAFFIFVNNTGSQDAEGFYGGSFAMSPSGQVLVQAKTDAEDMAIAEIDLDETRKIGRASCRERVY
jgi:predicted amidohydrolase